ncbi:aldehyde dehydrogenase family protein [Sporichthya sp.]|uniref:aldehyde dehydrogenase family protein n=1 Tax=Sporichthya sp. TaxID=65475 RepID=UPI0018157E1B|nr:aldehyde dehydrogenase family protein [Sporichthya sp.]MBA3741421.1 aldehyde dehydrogenase family protein [Sporichthya sp.]
MAPGDLDPKYTTKFLGPEPKQLLIGGKWVDSASGRTFETVNPSTGTVIARLAEADARDADLAVAAARAAFTGPWARFKPKDRQRVLLQLADLVEANLAELYYLDSVDMGAPISRAAGYQFSVDVLRFAAGAAMRIQGETVNNSVAVADLFSFTLKEPVGVVASIIPWNGPLVSSIAKIAPVLATGCTMVLKPAEEACISPLRLGELMAQLDLPDGVVNILTGFGEAGAALTEHPDVDKVAFTGSTATGQQIVRAASGNLKRLTLELGGKSPDVVFADADLASAVPGAAMGVFRNTGQVCCAGTRVYVERPVYDEFVERLSRFSEALRVGDSLDPETEIGPIVSARQLDQVLNYLDVGRSEGARPTSGGARITEGGLANGYFVAPTVFADVQDDMRIAREEIFGPVASILPFDDVEDVVVRANDTQFGLGAGVWTRDLGTAHRMARALRSGVVWVNTYGNFDPAMPFGGAKMSGWGSEYSDHGLDEYLYLKAVWMGVGN